MMVFQLWSTRTTEEKIDTQHKHKKIFFLNNKNLCGPLYLAILICHVLWLFFVSPNNIVKVLPSQSTFTFLPTILTFTTNSLSSLLSFFLPLFPCIQYLPISELCLNKSWDGVRLAFSYLWQQKRDALEQEFWFFFCGKNLLPSGIPLKECVWCTCLIIDGQFCNLGLLRELL